MGPQCADVEGVVGVPELDTVFIVGGVKPRARCRPCPVVCGGRKPLHLHERREVTLTLMSWPWAGLPGLRPGKGVFWKRFSSIPPTLTRVRKFPSSPPLRTVHLSARIARGKLSSVALPLTKARETALSTPFLLATAY